MKNFVCDQLRLRNHFCYVLITNGCFWITLGLCNRKIIIVYRDKSQSRICLFSTILDWSFWSNFWTLPTNCRQRCLSHSIRGEYKNLEIKKLWKENHCIWNWVWVQKNLAWANPRSWRFSDQLASLGNNAFNSLRLLDQKYTCYVVTLLVDISETLPWTVLLKVYFSLIIISTGSAVKNGWMRMVSSGYITGKLSVKPPSI